MDRLLYHMLESLKKDDLTAKVNDKYELTSVSKLVDDHLVYKIVAKKDFGNVKTGERGGWIEAESNLSFKGNCWVAKNAVVYGEAAVKDNALIDDQAKVCGKAEVCDNAIVFGRAEVRGNAFVSDSARVWQSATISGNAQVAGSAQVFGECKVGGNAIVGGNVRVCDNVSVHMPSLTGNEYVCGSSPVIGTILIPTAKIGDCYCTWLSRQNMVALEDHMLIKHFLCYTNNECAKHWCRIHEKNKDLICAAIDAFQSTASVNPKLDEENDLLLAYDAYISLYSCKNYNELVKKIYNGFKDLAYVKEWKTDPHLTLAYCKNVHKEKYNSIIKGLIDVNAEEPRLNNVVFDKVELVGKNRKELALVSTNADTSIMRKYQQPLAKQKCVIEYVDSPLVHITLLTLSSVKSKQTFSKTIDELNNYLQQNPISLDFYELNLTAYPKKARKCVLLKLC